MTLMFAFPSEWYIPIANEDVDISYLLIICSYTIKIN